MHWFKHDSTANADAKLKKVRIRYGLEGYGLYWYCLELIAGQVSKDKITFELEHDAEIIAHDTGLHYERVNEMMAYMVDLGLFEQDAGVITCLKMAQRLDQSMTSNPAMRKLISKVKSKNHDGVMTVPDSVMQDKTRIDKSKDISEQPVATAPVKQAKAPVCPYSFIQEAYNKAASNHFPSCQVMNDKRKRSAKKFFKTMNSDKTKVESYFNYVVGKLSIKPFYTGDNDTNWKADIEYMMRDDVVTKAVEDRL